VNGFEVNQGANTRSYGVMRNMGREQPNQNFDMGSYFG
jgi:hypothetical protein